MNLCRLCSHPLSHDAVDVLDVVVGVGVVLGLGVGSFVGFHRSSQ